MEKDVAPDLVAAVPEAETKRRRRRTGRAAVRAGRAAGVVQLAGGVEVRGEKVSAVGCWSDSMPTVTVY